MPFFNSYAHSGIALGPHSNADSLNYNIGILRLNKPLGCCFDAELQGGAWLIADSDNGRVRFELGFKSWLRKSLKFELKISLIEKK